MLGCVECEHRDVRPRQDGEFRVRSDPGQHSKESYYGAGCSPVHSSPVCLLAALAYLVFAFLGFCSGSQFEPSSKGAKAGSLSHPSVGLPSPASVGRNRSGLGLPSAPRVAGLDAVSRVAADAAHTRGLSGGPRPGTILSTLQTPSQGSGLGLVHPEVLAKPFSTVSAIPDIAFLSPLLGFGRGRTDSSSEAGAREPRTGGPADFSWLNHGSRELCSALCMRSAEGETRSDGCPEAQECLRKSVLEWVKAAIQKERVVVFTKR